MTHLHEFIVRVNRTIISVLLCVWKTTYRTANGGFNRSWLLTVFFFHTDALLIFPTRRTSGQNRRSAVSNWRTDYGQCLYWKTTEYRKPSIKSKSENTRFGVHAQGSRMITVNNTLLIIIHTYEYITSRTLSRTNSVCTYEIGYRSGFVSFRRLTVVFLGLFRAFRLVLNKDDDRRLTSTSLHAWRRCIVWHKNRNRSDSRPHRVGRVIRKTIFADDPGIRPRVWRYAGKNTRTLCCLLGSRQCWPTTTLKRPAIVIADLKTGKINHISIERRIRRPTMVEQRVVDGAHFPGLFRRYPFFTRLKKCSASVSPKKHTQNADLTWEKRILKHVTRD